MEKGSITNTTQDKGHDLLRYRYLTEGITNLNLCKHLALIQQKKTFQYKAFWLATKLIGGLSNPFDRSLSSQHAFNGRGRVKEFSKISIVDHILWRGRGSSFEASDFSTNQSNQRPAPKALICLTKITHDRWIEQSCLRCCWAEIKSKAISLTFDWKTMFYCCTIRRHIIIAVFVVVVVDVAEPKKSRKTRLR